MLVLGLESSCDETAAAVVEGDGDACTLRSSIIASQVELHRPYGGVVPELASRAHIINIMPTVEQALAEAKVSLADIDLFAVTSGPGLIGALLVAVQTAKALAFATGRPIVGVHHLEGHLTALSLERPMPWPHIALIVSGGHTSLVHVEGHGCYRTLGQTRDDAAGEAFDKGAKLLGLGYPGGVIIDRLAAGGNPSAIAFPRAMLHKGGGLDFSFSGLKTALLHYVRAHPQLRREQLPDVCASYQAAIVDALVRKTCAAVVDTGARHVQVCGGVAANSALRAQLQRAAADSGFTVDAPRPALCTDNAAMIAARGYYQYQQRGSDGWQLDCRATWPIGERAA